MTLISRFRPIHQGITATRTVLVDGPLVFNLGKASRGERPFDFHRGAPLRFGVLPRHGTAADAVWVDAECCFAYHGVSLCIACASMPNILMTIRNRSRQLLGRPAAPRPVRFPSSGRSVCKA